MMATLPSSDRPGPHRSSRDLPRHGQARIIATAAPTLLVVLAFVVTGLLLASEFESYAMGFVGACMIFLAATALRGAVSGAAARRR